MRDPEHKGEASGAEVSVVLPVSSEAAGKAREIIRGMGLDRQTLEDALLLTTELVTNSVRHAGLDESDTINMTAHWCDPVLKVWVRDRTDRQSVPVIGAIRPSPGAESGWGLYFVDRMSTRWGYDSSRGYWFELKRKGG